MATQRVLTNERFQEEWNYFYSNLTKASLTDFFNIEELKESLKTATCALSEDTGCAYYGALLVHINLFTRLALRIAKMVSNTFPMEESSLLKVCCLMHLSKIDMFEPNTNAWEVEKRGLSFKFKDIDGRLKFGERSLLNAVTKGIKFTPIEWEAMESLDNSDESKNGKYFDSILTIIVRQANELAYAIEKNNK